jgi:hypothetical protein
MVQRMPGPDIMKALNDPRAANSRFIFKYSCQTPCVLEATFADGHQITTPIAENIQGLRLDVDQKIMVIDSNTAVLTPASLWNRYADSARRITNFAFFSFRLIFPALIIIGSLAFASALTIRVRFRTFDATILVALSAWVFVFVRLSLVSVTNVSSFPAINAQYIAPATYMMAMAIVFSFAALLTAREYQKFR